MPDIESALEDFNWSPQSKLLVEVEVEQLPAKPQTLPVKSSSSNLVIEESTQKLLDQFPVKVPKVLVSCLRKPEDQKH